MLFDLLTLADSNLPVGSYAFSNGLEAASHLGILSSTDHLHDYITTAIYNTAQSELPFIQSCNTTDAASLSDILITYDAMLTTQTMAQASAVQGRNLIRIMNTLYPSDAMTQLRQTLLKQTVPAHYTIVYGTTFYVAGFAQIQTQQIFMYQMLRDQISAAVRLGIIGPMEAAQLQKRHHQTCEMAIQQTTDTPYTHATRSAPQIDITQSFHQHLYSRLFQS
jgi:urease accessory protein